MSKIKDAIIDDLNMVKEKPILMSTPMIQALLEGRKTQTRRVIKDQPEFMDKCYYTAFRRDFGGRKCPYGQVGTRLWVRETWSVFQLDSDCGKEFPNILYKADSSTRLLINEVVWKYNTPKFKWRPSIFMPRWASRITLEITDIKVQRLQEISHKDALAEGVSYDVSKEGGSPLERYKTLWDKINGKTHAWNLNEWVWVIEFKRIV